MNGSLFSPPQLLFSTKAQIACHLSRSLPPTALLSFTTHNTRACLALWHLRDGTGPELQRHNFSESRRLLEQIPMPKYQLARHNLHWKHLPQKKMPDMDQKKDCNFDVVSEAAKCVAAPPQCSKAPCEMQDNIETFKRVPNLSINKNKSFSCRITRDENPSCRIAQDFSRLCTRSRRADKN